MTARDPADRAHPQLMPDILRALGVLVALFATGAPIVACLRAKHLEWTAAVFEAVAVGLLVQVSLGIIALRLHHYSTVGLGTMTLLVIAAGVVGAITTRAHWHWPRFEGTWTLVVGALVAGALYWRQNPVYFLWESGDMGEYVNRANTVAEGSNLVQSFPHGFTVFLASTNTLLGEAHTTAGLPALGVVLLLGVVALARELGLRRAAALVVGIIVVVHPITVWFAEFPVSESLYASLLIAGLYFLVRARGEVLIGYGVVSGLLFGLMLIVRGNAMLLVPLVAIVFLASAIIDGAAVYRVMQWTTGVALAGLAIAYGYDVHFPRAYFVDKQLNDLLPKKLFNAGQRWHLFETSKVMVLSLILGFAVFMVLCEMVRRWLHPRFEPRALLFWRVLYAGTVLITTVIVLALLHTAGLVDGLARWGPLLVVLVLAGLLLLVAFPGRFVDGPVGLFLILGTALFTVLFATRVANPVAHPYYLYTDRYLFSEVLPLALVFVAISVHAGTEQLARLRERSRVAARAVAAAAAVLVAIGLLAPVSETWRITRHRLYGDPYGTMQRVLELAGNSTAAPIVYAGVPRPPPGFFFGNTYRVFAVPLVETFNRRVVGITSRNRQREPLYDPAGARAELAKAGFATGYLIDLRDPGAQPFPDGAHSHYVGTVDYNMPVLNRSKHQAPGHFHFVPVQLDVYAIS